MAKEIDRRQFREKIHGINYKTAGRRLAELREAMGWDIADFAADASRRAGLNTPQLTHLHVRMIEYGAEAPLPQYVAAFEDMFAAKELVEMGELRRLFGYNGDLQAHPSARVEHADADNNKLVSKHTLPRNIVHFVFSRFIASRDIGDVIHGLAARSYATPEGGWSEDYVRDILRDDSYTYPDDKLPPAVTQDDFLAAGQILFWQRAYSGRIAGAQKGYHQSGPAPYGYIRADGDLPDYSTSRRRRVIIPYPPEAEVVQFIFREYLGVKSVKRVIETLHNKWLYTRRGKQWSRAGVSWILKNDTYVGRVHFAEIHVKGQHELLISPIMFHNANKLLRENNKKCSKKQESVSEAQPIPLEECVSGEIEQT